MVDKNKLLIILDESIMFIQPDILDGKAQYQHLDIILYKIADYCKFTKLQTKILLNIFYEDYYSADIVRKNNPYGRYIEYPIIVIKRLGNKRTSFEFMTETEKIIVTCNGKMFELEHYSDYILTNPALIFKTRDFDICIPPIPDHQEWIDKVKKIKSSQTKQPIYFERTVSSLIDNKCVPLEIIIDEKSTIIIIDNHRITL